ncbi:hypothetical protein AXW83_23755 [Bosea sp. PAMC 26642]|nr:hypothetical protein AXW83_23755 [Bosea sp. PAMC 26642]
MLSWSILAASHTAHPTIEAMRVIENGSCEKEYLLHHRVRDGESWREVTSGRARAMDRKKRSGTEHD